MNQKEDSKRSNNAIDPRLIKVLAIAFVIVCYVMLFLKYLILP